MARPTSAATPQQVRGSLRCQLRVPGFGGLWFLGILGHILLPAPATWRAREPHRHRPCAGGVHGWHTHLRGRPQANESYWKGLPTEMLVFDLHPQG